MNRERKYKGFNKYYKEWLFDNNPNFSSEYKRLCLFEDSKLIQIDPATICDLITKIGDVEIYEYDCWYRDGIMTYFYYDKKGVLYYKQFENINGVRHITDFFMDYQYTLEKTINNAKFIGNWHDGEEYLLTKIKELGYERI